MFGSLWALAFHGCVEVAAIEQSRPRTDFASGEHVQEALGRDSALLGETGGLEAAACAAPCSTAFDEALKKLGAAELVQVVNGADAVGELSRVLDEQLFESTSGDGMREVIRDQIE